MCFACVRSRGPTASCWRRASVLQCRAPHCVSLIKSRSIWCYAPAGYRLSTCSSVKPLKQLQAATRVMMQEESPGPAPEEAPEERPHRYVYLLIRATQAVSWETFMHTYA